MESHEQHKRCLDCGYILTGLPENRCPECGRTFDPDNPETYAGRPKCGVPLLIAASAAMCGVLAGCGILALIFRHVPLLGSAGAVFVCAGAALALAFGSFLFGSWTAGKCCKAIELPRGAMCHRSCLVIALAFTVPFRVLLHMSPELSLLLLALLTLGLWRLL